MTRKEAIKRLNNIADRESAWMEEIGLPDASQIGAFLREVAEMLKKDEKAWNAVKYCVIDAQMTTGNDKEYDAFSGVAHWIDEQEKRWKDV